MMGRKGKLNAAAAMHEKLVLCNASQPTLDGKALVDQAVIQNKAVYLTKHALETGGEDMPDALRTVPCHPDDLRVNVTGLYSSSAGGWQFQEMWCLMFGYSSGVTNFNRWAKFLEAAGRRCCSLLWSMYYGDGSIRDLGHAKGAGQALINSLFDSVPLSSKKQQRMPKQAEFLGLAHNARRAFSHNGSGQERAC